MCRLPATAAVSETTAVEVLQTDSWQEALELKAAHPDAVPIAGGTDLMVELNFDRIRPRVDPRPHADSRADRMGARERSPARRGRRHVRAADRRARRPPARAGDRVAHGGVAPDPQPRDRRRQPRHLVSRRGRAAAAVRVRCRGRARLEGRHAADSGGRVRDRAEAKLPRGRRADRGLPHRPRRRPAAVRQDRHPQRDGDRGLLARAVASGRSGKPSPRASAPRGRRRSGAARRSTSSPACSDEHDLWSKRAPIPDAALARFGELVERAARPIDDVRGTARYRHHALGVLGRRTLTWAWEAYRCA